MFLLIDIMLSVIMLNVVIQSVIQYNDTQKNNVKYFSVTLEMRTTKCGEIYISIDAHTTAERVYKG